jgi:enamine deaminase RidA (YjgF/YER057c/UK114 family)
VGLEDRLRELGTELPPPVPPGGLYNPVVFHGNVAYISGQVPLREGQLVARGKLGQDVSVEEGQQAARLCVLNALAALRHALESLDSVDRPLKMTVFVASAPGFNDQPQVANGASQLLIDLFGHDNRPARSAVGVSELPLDCPVEVELIMALTAAI